MMILVENPSNIATWSKGNDSLEVYSKTQLDNDDASSSSNDYIDANALNEELSIVCEKLLEKYNLLKKKSLD